MVPRIVPAKWLVRQRATLDLVINDGLEQAEPLEISLCRLGRDGSVNRRSAAELLRGVLFSVITGSTPAGRTQNKWHDRCCEVNHPPNQAATQPPW